MILRAPLHLLALVGLLAAFSGQTARSQPDQRPQLARAWGPHPTPPTRLARARPLQRAAPKHDRPYGRADEYRLSRQHGTGGAAAG
jgi:hypothetical protein